MRRVAALYGGNATQWRGLHEPKYRCYLAEIVYLLDLPSVDLGRFDALLVPDRMHQGRLVAAAEQLRGFLDGGGTIAAFDEQPRPWLPGVRWEHRPTNFWWWREPGGASGLAFPRPDHGLFRYLTPADLTWHYHGVFCPPPGAETLVAAEDGAAVLYVDRVSTDGTLVVSSLDPIYHFGSYFMPAAERFLDRFLPWLAGAAPPPHPLEPGSGRATP